MADQTVILSWLELVSAHPETAVFRCHSEESCIWGTTNNLMVQAVSRDSSQSLS